MTFSCKLDGQRGPRLALKHDRESGNWDTDKQKELSKLHVVAALKTQTIDF